MPCHLAVNHTIAERCKIDLVHLYCVKSSRITQRPDRGVPSATDPLRLRHQASPGADLRSTRCPAPLLQARAPAQAHTARDSSRSDPPVRPGTGALSSYALIFGVSSIHPSPLLRLCTAFSVGALSIPTLIEINGYSYNGRIMRVSEFRHVEDEEVVRLLKKAPEAGSLSAP